MRGGRRNHSPGAVEAPGLYGISLTPRTDATPIGMNDGPVDLYLAFGLERARQGLAGADDRGPDEQSGET